MNAFMRLLRRPRPLSDEQLRRLDAYRTLPRADDDLDLYAPRYVVTDVETSGLRPYSDRLIAIGGIAVTGGLLRFDDVFSTVLRQADASSNANILVHGIDGTTQTGAADPAAALLDFLEFAQSSPLVGFHADFDRVFVTRATKETLGMTAPNAWLDLAQLAPAFFPEHAARAQSLDDWTQIFGIDNYARHNAVADAVATAQLLQVVLAQARREGVRKFRELTSHAHAQRWLEWQR